MDETYHELRIDCALDPSWAAMKIIRSRRLIRRLLADRRAVQAREPRRQRSEGRLLERIRELEANQGRLAAFVRQVRAVAGSDGFTDRYDWCETATELLSELEDGDG